MKFYYKKYKERLEDRASKLKLDYIGGGLMSSAYFIVIKPPYIP